MGLDPSAVWDFAAELVGSVRGGSRRTTATVTRIDADGTTWVTTGDGGEAPATSVGAGVSVGDTVTLEWDGSAMGIRSNVSNPAPAGSVVRRAIDRAQGVASAAQRVADAVNQHFFADTSGIHVTEATQEEWDENHSGANVLINSIGQLFRDGLNNLLTLTTENGARALTVWDGLGNAASNVRAVIGETIMLGNASSGSVVTIDSDSMDMVHGTTEMLHFGYGEGTAEDGTAVAPYYTIGRRAANSTVGNYSVAEGYLTTAKGAYSHAEGGRTSANGGCSHAEGGDTAAGGADSHAEGFSTVAIGTSSHAEGSYTSARGASSHAEGSDTIASGENSHAEGDHAVASGENSHAEGSYTTASGNNSHAGGFHTIAAGVYQAVFGRYNANDSAHAFEVGNGTSNNRSNAFAVDWQGNVECAGTISPTATASTVTASSGASVTGDNACWNNGAACAFVLVFKCSSSLASNGTLTVGTLPEGYRPPYNLAVDVYTSAVAHVVGYVSTDGTVSIRNVGSSALATTTTLRVSSMWAVS